MINAFVLVVVSVLEHPSKNLYQSRHQMPQETRMIIEEELKNLGSDGKEYAFLLKGHEDPRQDERVMQLFGLINSLILRENDTCRRNLSIQVRSGNIGDWKRGCYYRGTPSSL